MPKKSKSADGVAAALSTKNLVYFLIIALVGYFLVNFISNKIAASEGNFSFSSVYQPRRINVQLASENSSGETGSAVLVERNGKTVVSLSIVGSPKGIAQPAHIHAGSCPGVGEIKYSLTNVINGKSETTINATIAEIIKMEPLAINVHKSGSDIKTYVACGLVK